MLPEKFRHFLLHGSDDAQPFARVTKLLESSEFLRQNFTDLHTFILGAIIIVAVVLLPQGAVNYVSEARRTKEFSLLANVRKYRL